ncbi:MAG: hypothetical protein ABIY55_05920 [Kofleriaceae bacterium]
MALIAGCQGKSEPDPPRPPPPVIEARANGATIAHIVDGHPCRAEVGGEELMIGTMPLVAQVGNSRWSGDDIDDGTTLRKDGVAIVRLRDLADASVEVFDPRGVAILHVSADGTVADARGEIVRRVDATSAALKIGDSIVTGTSDLALGVLVTAPELIPEVRALAACRRLFAREQSARK